MITLYLLRHCDYANPLGIVPGRLPVELSEKGWSQARKLQAYFQDKNITKIFSSAVLRCQQTAETISNHQIPIEYDKRLLETFSSFQGFWEIDWMKFYNMRQTLGGESNQEIQDRMLDFTQNTPFLNEHSYIICSHGDPLYFLYQSFIHTPLLSDMVREKIPPTPDDYLQKGECRKILLDDHKNVLEVFPKIIPEQL